MTKEAGSTNDEKSWSLCSSFGHSSFLRASSFGFRHFSFRDLTEGRQLFVPLARRPRCRFQQRVFFAFLVERFDGYRAPDLDRLLLLRLDGNCFANLGSGFCRFSIRLVLACGLACRLYLTRISGALALLIFGRFRCRLRCWLGLRCRLVLI